jgi:hypothetical protein
MNFTITLPREADAEGVEEVFRLFPTATTIEVLNGEVREAEYRVTYQQEGAGSMDYELPQKAAEAVVKAWPDQADSILQGIRFAGDHYSFNRWGMYVGVEADGYIHT